MPCVLVIRHHTRHSSRLKPYSFYFQPEGFGITAFHSCTTTFCVGEEGFAPPLLDEVLKLTYSTSITPMSEAELPHGSSFPRISPLTYHTLVASPIIRLTRSFALFFLCVFVWSTFVATQDTWPSDAFCTHICDVHQSNICDVLREQVCHNLYRRKFSRF